MLRDVEPDSDGEADNIRVCVGDTDAAGCCDELGAIIVVPSTLLVRYTGRGGQQSDAFLHARLSAPVRVASINPAARKL